MNAPLPHDPELDPVPAAQAALDAEVAQSGVDVGATTPRPIAPAGSRARPVIAPARPEDWTSEVKLQYPLMVDDVLVDRLVLRRITARDVAELVMDGLEGVSLNAAARALVAGVHPDVLENLAASDAEAVLGTIGPFLPPAVIALAEAMEDALSDQ
jgi:hypothetical protein